jgi:hypothetical protein
MFRFLKNSSIHVAYYSKTYHILRGTSTAQNRASAMLLALTARNYNLTFFVKIEQLILTAELGDTRTCLLFLPNKGNHARTYTYKKN